MKRRVWGILLGFFFVFSAHAFEAFRVDDIRVEGLQRISAGTVFNYLPLKVGETLTAERSAEAIRALYQTGFFEDVRLERDGQVLVVFVEERPAIADIDISGNQAIPSEQLTDALQQIGLAQGRVFDPSTLERITLELKRQYNSLGKYAVRIDSTVEPLERNRVAISIDIAEGEAARIHQINIVGNEAFPETELLDYMQLSDVGLFGGKSEYSKQLLSADLESLRSYYLDRGYVDFSINSTQVSLTPDLQDVYITVNVSEGRQYTVDEIELAGNLIVEADELRDLISVRKGEVFSRREATASSERITARLGEEGYAFANVNIAPDLDEDAQTVNLRFLVDPGRRVYVRRINISGNSKTQDEVIRRELRQFEDAWLSTEKVARSRTRLERLGFFERVDVETPAVPGSPDQVDVNFNVVERATGSLSAGVGYSDTQGVLFNFSVAQENFVGTGNRLAVALENSDVTDLYSVSYTNPYYTLDGVSRGFRGFYRNVNAAEAQLSNYTTNSYGLFVDYGFPLSEYNTGRLGFGYEYTELLVGPLTSQKIIDYIDENGSTYDSYKVTGSWAHDTRNRAIFADRGQITSVSSEVALPGGSLEFYKVNLRHLRYLPFGDDLTLALNGELGYGDGYGGTDQLPPFENFYAGGSRSVRGYRGNSLGPRDDEGANRTFDPLGGNARVVASAELLFPNPFANNSDSVRMSAFVDAGNVYDTQEASVDLGELRYSVGLGATWLTPIGALRFSLAEPINPEPDDELERFQFTLGTPF